MDERLSEIDCGIWDGLTFEEIRRRYPEEYAERGEHIASYTIEGGESFYDVCGRVSECIDEVRGSSKSDLVFVTHAGAIRSYLAIGLGCAAPDDLMGIELVCGGVTVLAEASDGEIRVLTNPGDHI